MFRNITLGQYYPIDSILHRMDPRTKLFGTLFFIIIVFLATKPLNILIVTLFLIVEIKLSKVPLSMIIRGLKGVIALILVAGVFNIFLTTGEPVFKWHFITITREGLYNAGYMLIRIVYTVIGTSIMTYTTTPKALTEGLEKGLSCLNKIKVPVHEMAMMMSIALRYIPILTEETDKIMKAQMARGADFEHGNIIKRAKNMVPLLVPLFVNAFRRASDLAIAMEARCYHGGEGRTKMKPLKYGKVDLVGYIVIILLFVISVLLEIEF